MSPWDILGALPLLQIGLFVAWVLSQVWLGAAAFLRGGWVERTIAFTSIAAWLVGLAIVLITQQWQPPHLGLLLVDSAFFAALLTVGLIQAGRQWPLVAAGFQLASLALHGAAFINPAATGPAYFLGLKLTSYLVFGTIAFGVWQAWRRGAAAERR